MSTSERAEPAETAPAAPAAPAAPEAGPSSLEQVREILFGPQARDLNRRLAHVDVHFAAQAEELRREAARRLEVLEAYVRKELEGLVASIEAQRTVQIEALETNGREARDAIRLLEHRVSRLEEGAARAQRDVREQLLAQAKTFLDEVRRAREELGAAIERELVVTWGESIEQPAPLPEPGQREAA